MSSSISLIGWDPSRGAYLFSSSSTMNVSGPAGPLASLRSSSRREHHADHEPLRPVRQGVQVDHRDLGLGGRHRRAAAQVQVAADQRPERPTDECSRRRNALTVPSAGRRPAPLPGGTSSVTWSSRESTRPRQ